MVSSTDQRTGVRVEPKGFQDHRGRNAATGVPGVDAKVPEAAHMPHGPHGHDCDRVRSSSKDSQVLRNGKAKQIRHTMGKRPMTEKITPETYEKMNKEFEEEGLAFRIIVPTQEQIDKWRQRD